ncbi:MAG TPA: NAD-binding protein [Thermoanaerobaculia bacterium]|nr:NAD-binding protein [Thermoanaerobaculia bacterium]
MTGHYIVCGMGDVGYRVVELLRRLGEEVVVVTLQVREDRQRIAESFGVRIAMGDARNEQLLRDAGLASAKSLIAATDQDLVNIEVALDARRLRPDIPLVLRLFDPDLARQLEGAFDLRRAIGMSTLAAPSFAAAAIGEALLTTFSLEGTSFVVGRHRASEGPLRDCPTVDDLARRHNLITLMVERPDQDCLTLPEGGTAILPNDRLSLLGHKEDWDRFLGSPRSSVSGRHRGTDRVPFALRMRRSLSRLLRFWREEPLPLRVVFLSLCLLIPLTIAVFYGYLRQSLVDAVFLTITNLHGEVVLPEDVGPEIKLYEVLLMILGSVTLATLYSMLTDFVVGSRLRKLLGSQPMPRQGHVVVVGMGNVGFRVVRELTAVGVPVVAVDADADRPFLADVRTRASVVIGDARLSDTLLRSGIARARAVVAATGDDSVNLGIGLAARQSNPRIRTVVRLFDAEFARKVESALGIDAALGASRIAAPTFAASALFSDVVKAFIVQDRLLVLLRRKAGAEWAGRKPSDLQDIRILMRNRALSSDDRPLVAEEEVLAALWRKLAPSWTGHSSDD